MPYSPIPFLNNGYDVIGGGDYNSGGNWGFDSGGSTNWGGYNPNDWLNSLGIQNLTPNSPFDPLTDISGFTNFTNQISSGANPITGQLDGLGNPITYDAGGNVVNVDSNGVRIGDPSVVNAPYGPPSPNPTSIFGGQVPAIPIPGISWPVALGATALLNDGNIFGGGGSIANLPGAVSNVVSNPVQSVTSTVNNIGDQIMGPPSPTQAGSAPIIPVSWPTSNVGAPATQNPTTGQGTANPTQGGTPPVVAVNPPLNPTPNQPASGPSAPTQTTTPPVAPVTTNQGNSPLIPATPYPTQTTGPNQGGTPPITPIVNNPPSDTAGNPTPDIHPLGPGTPETTTPPVVTTPTTTGTGVTVPPIVPTTPTMPDTSVASPLDRNFLREGNQSTSDLNALLSGIAGLYGNASGSAGQTDFTNFQNILSQFGGSNSNLTGLANQQTQASNTALRQNNLNDVQNLLPQATAIRNAANPGLLGDTGSLQNYSNGALSFLQQAQQQQNDANYLSPQERNTAQQSARDAWGARGLINSPGAVGDEILNTDAALRARQQQAFTNTQGALGTYGQSVGAQQQNVFDPFGAVLGAQYGQQTSNAGNNNNLYGQSAAFSSGQQGNAYAQNMSNPFNPYAQDVYNSNFGAANARNISASNNAAAAAGANSAQSSALANSFLRLFGQAATSSSGSGGLFCWAARSAFGSDNPRWLLFRYWMLNKAPTWFRNFYIKHGEKFALWMDNNAWCKPLVRSFMNSRIETISPEIQALVY